MAPVSSKTNFKTYDAQARLLRAIVAAHPEVRWNYKEIVKHFGSDMTEYALDHRFRAIKTHSKIVKDAVSQGVDCINIPGDLPKDKKDIAKFFGESTADGIQFQFRSIKKDADSLKQTANSGGNPATALNLSGGGPSSALSTPRKATPSKPRASGGGRSTAKKANPIKLQPLSDADDDEDDDVDYNALEDTPSKSRVRDRVVDGRIAKNTSRRSNTPSRAATIAAAASISQAAAVDLTTSDSEVNTPDNTTGYEPAPADAKPAFLQQQQQPQHQQQAEQHLAQPMVQPAASFYAPSSFSQESSADIFFGNASDDLLHPSFVDSFADGYLDNDGIGEI
ncbi:uncharacterized protein CTRU02_201761 [Colletotrichum truncatum]|uniref:Uncharacterized protein n=1 Tax=Colletotrichum truncatum TaxID=5467 RepID=A0ACC3ZI81_COLTU|nr:uncharacterized protein CTRU02_11648 [Colletotrichum truncatum]KAF6785663.1 hypothetical protein CTRU02_11648 [Colletotrichum truncatum]